MNNIDMNNMDFNEFMNDINNMNNINNIEYNEIINDNIYLNNKNEIDFKYFTSYINKNDDNIKRLNQNKKIKKELKNIYNEKQKYKKLEKELKKCKKELLKYKTKHDKLKNIINDEDITMEEIEELFS
jgi:flagellar motility protein MotE (MotC chaperone)